jgi:hypothetical protein
MASVFLPLFFAPFSLPCSGLFFDLFAFGGLFFRPFFSFWFFIGVASPLLFFRPFFLLLL